MYYGARLIFRYPLELWLQNILVTQSSLIYKKSQKKTYAFCVYLAMQACAKGEETLLNSGYYFINWTPRMST